LEKTEDGFSNNAKKVDKEDVKKLEGEEDIINSY
tara:strand:- start:4877 stop:4978 length:102 start_codon:yes stop_codon:yes gene_type:complete